MTRITPGFDPALASSLSGLPTHIANLVAGPFRYFDKVVHIAARCGRVEAQPSVLFFYLHDLELFEHKSLDCLPTEAT